MKYFKIGDNYDSSSNSLAEEYLINRGWTEITKAEYDKAVTYPALSDDNVNHNLFNNSESAWRKEKQRYQNSLFTLTEQPDGSFLIVVSKNNKVMLDNLNAYLKAVADIDAKRANTYVQGKLNNDDDDTIQENVMKHVIDLSDLAALNGRNEFIGWLLAEHPTTLRQYVQNVNALDYSTFLSEDETLPFDQSDEPELFEIKKTYNALMRKIKSKPWKGTKK